MGKNDSLQGSLELLILKVLSRQPSLHGYALMTAIRGASGEVLRVEEGSLYPALHRLEEQGAIKAQWVERDGGRRSRVYALSAAGKKRLAAEEDRWRSTSAAILRVLEAM
ncbi:MAG: PadR family transcriptional regulator [Bryobacteraceae bacterium]